MIRGATVSDLHLFSHHSRSQRYMDWIRETADEVDFFVLNGDIFDFKWSRHGPFTRSIQAAATFLDQLCRSHPHCRFIIVLGNHDAVPPYIRTLEQLANSLPNLQWHEFVARIDDRIFLHGDLIHAGTSNKAIRSFRQRLRVPANGHPLQRLAHGAVHRSRLPWMAFRLLPKRILASRILTYLRHEDCLQPPPRHIYFGHTHSDFQDFRYRGFLFHNCGSATHGGRLRVVRFNQSQTANP